jgi:hypothetical protein
MKASSDDQPTKPSGVSNKQMKKKSSRGLTCALFLLLVILLLVAGGFLIWNQYGPQIAQQIASINIIITTSTATPSQPQPTQVENIQTQPPIPNPTDTALPTPEPSPTIFPSNTPTFTPPPASLTPITTSLPPTTEIEPETSPYDLVFVSNRDGIPVVYAMDSAHTQEWRSLGVPEGYEFVRWPSFCGNQVLYEVEDRALTLPRWVYVVDMNANSLESFKMPEGMTADRLASPTCSPSGRYMGISAQRDYVWRLDILDLVQSSLIYEQESLEYPMLGFATWGKTEDNFLWMGFRSSGYFDLNETSGYLTPGNATTRFISQGKYPAFSPTGDYLAYFCGNMLDLCLAAWPSGEIVSQQAINYYKKIDGEQVTSSVSWSRDGKWLYFASSQTGNWDIYRMHPDGSEMQNLTIDWPSDEIMPASR